MVQKIVTNAYEKMCRNSVEKTNKKKRLGLDASAEESRRYRESDGEERAEKKLKKEARIRNPGK